jgi:SAM-dependent methyltransferase
MALAPNRHRLSNARTRAGALMMAYRAVYAILCGRHPRLKPWHFQYLSGTILYRTLPSRLSLLDGVILDVGCGEQPYRQWMTRAERYVGLDTIPGPTVDVVIEPGRPWPLPADEFDGIVCTQVIEHVAQLDLTLAEITRTLRPGGRLVLSVPFIYNEHDPQHDYRRLSRHGVRQLLGPQYAIEEIVPQGAVGSTLGAMFLNWVELSMTRTGITMAVLTLLFPAWLALCAAVNCLGLALDRLDRTNAFYGNVLVVARLREARALGV